MIPEKLFYRYTLCSLAYGFVRKVNQISNAKLYTHEYDKETREYYYKPRPMLMTDKAAAITISTLAAPWILPCYVYNDLSYLEMRLRKLDPNEYGDNPFKRSWISYLF